MSKGKTNIRRVGGKTLGNATVLDYAYDIPNDVIYVSSGPRPSFSPLDQPQISRIIYVTARVLMSAGC
ncbi:hypothetical protein P692DRAFT_20832041 [Suillus brevipes Sb2]|nr:hypothetical protein P692DRAFT_20832041 [Suillus brevipes Sb2]